MSDKVMLMGLWLCLNFFGYVTVVLAKASGDQAAAHCGCLISVLACAAQWMTFARMR